MKKPYTKVKKNPVTVTIEDVSNGKVRYVHGTQVSETPSDVVVTFVDRGRTLSEFFSKSQWRIKRTSGAVVGPSPASSVPHPDAVVQPAQPPEIPVKPTEKSPGNLLTTLKGEYNAWNPPDRMGPELANTAINDARVAANFTTAEAQRKLAQIKAKNAFQRVLNPSGGQGVNITTGFVPD